MAILSFAINFILLPICVFGLVDRFYRPSNRKDQLLISIVSLGVGPVILPWFLGLLLLVYPGQNSTVYQFLLFGTVTAISILFVRRSRIAFFLKPLLSIVRESSVRLMYIPPLIAAIFVLIFSQLPWDQNDALEYFQVAKQFVLQSSIRNYPFLNSDITNGLIFPSTHLPGYPLTIATSFFLRGATSLTFDIKFFSAFYFVLLTLLFFAVRPASYRVVSLGSTLFSWTPFVMNLAIVGHVDSVRFFFLASSVIVAQKSLHERTFFWGILCIQLAFLSYFYHSLGLLALFFIGILFFIKLFSNFRLNLYIGFAGIVLFILLFLPFVFLVYVNTGSIISDAALNPILAKNISNSAQYFYLNRGLTNRLSIFYHGFLQFLTQVNIYGSAYYLVGAAFIYLLFKKSNGRIQSIMSRPFFISYPFWLFMLLSLFMFLKGSFEVFKNPRYFLTVHFFFSLFGGYILRSVSLTFWRNVRYLKMVTKKMRFKNVFGIIFLIALPVLTNSYQNFSVIKKNLLTIEKYRKAKSDFEIYHKRLQFSWVKTVDSLPKDSVFLTWRQSDFGFFSNRRFYSHFDPKIIPVYNSDSKDNALNRLQKLGIRFIHFPVSNFSATFVHSWIAEITADPHMAIIRHMNLLGDRIIEIGNFKDRYLDLVNGAIVVPMTSWEPQKSQSLNSEYIYGAKDDHFWSQSLVTLPHVSLGKILRVGSEYQTSIDLSGNGMVNIKLILMTGNKTQKMTLWRGILTPEVETIKVLFKIMSEYDSAELTIEPVVAGNVIISKTAFLKVGQEPNF